MSASPASEEPADSGLPLEQSGQALIQGMLDSTRVAVDALERSLREANPAASPDVRAVMETVATGYVTLTRELARNAQHMAVHFRSESGRLVAKRWAHPSNEPSSP